MHQHSMNEENALKQKAIQLSMRHYIHAMLQNRL